MKKGYWVVAYRSISDASAVKAYGALAVPAVQSFGGRFLQAGYTAIQLHTEYCRLPAIKTYLNLGYVPSIASPEVWAIWEGVCARLCWPFTPEAWTAQA